MILNKSAHERGFAHGSIYKSQIVDLKTVRGDKGTGGVPNVHFGLGKDVRPDDKKRLTLDDDGFPFLGTLMKSGDAVCAYVDRTTGRTQVEKFHGDEAAYVEEVRIICELFVLLTEPATDKNSKRVEGLRGAEGAHQVPSPAQAGNRGQVLISTRTEGCQFAAVPRGGHALLRVGNAARHHHQPPRVPVSDDDRHVRRVYCGQGGSDARLCAGRHPFLLLGGRHSRGLLWRATASGRLQLSRERADVLGHHGQGVCGRHLHRRRVLPTSASHGRGQVPSPHDRPR